MQQIRHAADMTLAEAKDLCGIDRGTLSRIERGAQMPADDQIAALELVYGQSVTWWPAEVRALLKFDGEDGSA